MAGRKPRISPDYAVPILNTMPRNMHLLCKCPVWRHIWVKASRFIGIWTVCSTACSGYQQRKHQSSSESISTSWCRPRFILATPSLRWRHSGCDSVSNHQPHDCLLNRLFRRRSKKTSKLRVTGLFFVRGIHRGPVNSPHKWPVTRKMFPFDDVIMYWCHCVYVTWWEKLMYFHSIKTPSCGIFLHWKTFIWNFPQTCKHKKNTKRMIVSYICIRCQLYHIFCYIIVDSVNELMF